VIRWFALFAFLLAVPLAGSAEQPSMRARLGQEVTLEGVAEARKLGAALRGDGFDVWIDQLEHWPPGTAGRKVRVTGILEERHDLPVFIQKEGEPAAAGIPVPPGTDLRKASQRYVVRDAKWSLIQ
jgi:hypothetical protein